jgi:hypothetical protein
VFEKQTKACGPKENFRSALGRSLPCSSLGEATDT